MTDKPSNAIANWLFIGALLVAGIVITGGITRLTHSGLSMVTWEPISGIIPPLNEADWQAEFENYKTSPEFQLKNSHFDIKEFKNIFWWEYIHRLFARVIGLVFIFPFLYFLFTKQLRNKVLLRHLLFIFLLGAFQGFLGWFMVSSGLVDEPRVDHYRLAAHLLAALSLFAYILWIALHIKYGNSRIDPVITAKTRPLIIALLVLLGVQITYGAFMAGLHAGLLFPSFPKMGQGWFPPAMGLIFSEEGLLAIMENPFLVQFIHRWVPLFIIILAGVLLFRTEGGLHVTKSQKWIIRILNLMILIQVILGVYTLLFSVPLTLGVLHQFGAVILLAISLLGLFFFRRGNIFGKSS